MISGIQLIRLISGSPLLFDPHWHIFDTMKEHHTETAFDISCWVMQMLLQSKLVRSQSSFQLLEQFIQEGIIGRSKHSEVSYEPII